MNRILEKFGIVIVLAGLFCLFLVGLLATSVREVRKVNFRAFFGEFFLWIILYTIVVLAEFLDWQHIKRAKMARRLRVIRDDIVYNVCQFLFVVIVGGAILLGFLLDLFLGGAKIISSGGTATHR